MSTNIVDTANFHGTIKKREAEALCNHNGDFLFRNGKGNKDYVLCVVFKGKCTHHQVTVKDDKLAINGKVTSATTLSEVILLLTWHF